MKTGLLKLLGVPGLSFVALSSGSAQAQEVYAGASFHGVDTPFSLETYERGQDIQAGIRSAPIKGLSAIGSPQAYLHAQVSIDGQTNMAAAGLSWKIGDTLYLRPGIGLAIHDGQIPRAVGMQRVDLGSRILFEPEISAGVKLGNRTAVELSWVHISHATLFSGQNPGLEFIGARLVWKLK